MGEKECLLYPPSKRKSNREKLTNDYGTMTEQWKGKDRDRKREREKESRRIYLCVHMIYSFGLTIANFLCKHTYSCKYIYTCTHRHTHIDHTN